MPAVLVCPLCGTVVVDGAEPRAGDRCPGCGARYEGDAADVVGAVRAACEALGARDVDPEAAARALFALDPADPGACRVAITSDRREGFYRWWVFVAPGGDDARTLREIAAP